MKSLYQVPAVAVVLIVLLRIAIGWQFLYEGLWKYKAQSSPAPWSAEGYLKQAQGPFRDYFRNMTGDPDDLGWLNYDHVDQQWSKWYERFKTHYGLSQEQQDKLQGLLDGPETVSVELKAEPPGVDVKKLLTKSIKSEKGDWTLVGKTLTVKADAPLLPSEVEAIRKELGVVKVDPKTYARVGAKNEENPQPVEKELADFCKSIDDLAEKSAKLSYRRRLRASLKGDPDRVGAVIHFLENTDKTEFVSKPLPDSSSVDAKDYYSVRYGEIQIYKNELAQYEKDRKQAKTESDFAHLERLWTKLQGERTKLSGPVKTLEKGLKDDAQKLLDSKQILRGSLPPEDSPLVRANHQAMWGLLILGTLLIFGLGTRIGAIGGAVMLLSFYLVVPPWAGVPQPPGPEHS